jgi:hypothetical protein
MIANRLKLILPKIIHETQSAFVPSRLITENAMIDFESFHRMRRRRGRQGFMSLKLDMCKAYDKVEWSFLRGIILKMGFNHNWVDLVMRCVTTASYSILINGIPGENLNPERGLKKGAPLSTYLFLLCAEYEDHERKICSTAWDIICRNKLGGGLGFRKLMLFQ